ncbi:MAG: Alcohol dehydrogenase (EC [uncultured Paraburkholderia sp.]|nr:MAG: Alcohol dehydrogenase (EC [uncultured Paraburkholderia sp.]
MAARVVETLANKDIEVLTVRDVQPEPTIENVETVYRDQIAPFAPDAVLAIGGGSVLDAAKLFAVRLTNHAPLRDWLGIDLIASPGVPLILVPTTSGTGSEVTPNAIVTLPDEELKVGIVSRHLLPQLVILDATLTLDLPKPITAATGMDAFIHALESYISTKANPVSDMYAMESMRLIGGNLIEAYENGHSLKAREAMLLGSMYGDLALTAAVHALAYPLGGMFNITHGVANSMLLPHVMEFNLDAIVGRLANVAHALGLARYDDSDDAAANALLASSRLDRRARNSARPAQIRRGRRASRCARRGGVESEAAARQQPEAAESRRHQGDLSPPAAMSSPDAGSARLLIIGDDLSGTADCAVTCARHGLTSVVSLGPAPAMDAARIDVLAIDTDTRRQLPADAARANQEAWHAHSAGRRIYKKIDSTLLGNVAAEVAALASVAGMAVVAPAFPQAGRTTRGARQFVFGTPVMRARSSRPVARLRVPCCRP